jgi:hypothetical protein
VRNSVQMRASVSKVLNICGIYVTESAIILLEEMVYMVIATQVFPYIFKQLTELLLSPWHT